MMPGGRASCVAVLAKPFTNEALLKTLYSLLPTDR